MNAPLEILTARTRIWLPLPAEASCVLEYFTKNVKYHESTSPFFPDGFYTEGYWRERLQLSYDEFQRDLSVRLFFAMTESPEKIIGSISLSQIIRGPFQACYLGYSLAEEAEGKGLMSEALGAVVKYAFQTLRLHRIMANYLPENHRSGRVLDRLGFKIDGRSSDYLFIRGEWREHVLTSLTNPNWTPRETDRFLFEEKI